MEVRRRRGETFESFLRRFNKRLLLSGKLFQARKIRFYKPEKTKREQRVSALRKQAIIKRIDYLKRTGMYKEEPPQRPRRG